MSSGKPKGKRRGRPPKKVNDPSSEFSGMFVLPPNILQKLGINLNVEDVQHAQTSSALPVNQPHELSSSTQIEPNFAMSVQSNEAIAVNRKSGDSSILETANLMKSSVFLSPTFNHPVTNTNIVNAEIEFLSLNQDETNAAVAVEKQISDEPLTFPTAEDSHRNHTAKDTPGAIKTTRRKKGKSKRSKALSVGPESIEASLDIHAEMIENLRKKIQLTIENVISNSEEMHVDSVSHEIGASTDNVVPKSPVKDYVIPENTVRDINDHSGILHANLTSQQIFVSPDTVELKRAVADYAIPENTVRGSNDHSFIENADHTSQKMIVSTDTIETKRDVTDNAIPENIVRGSNDHSFIENVDHTRQKINASSDTVEPKRDDNAIHENTVRGSNDHSFLENADHTSQKMIASTNTIEPRQIVADYFIPQNTVRDFNDNSEIVDTPKINDTHPAKTKLDTTKEINFDSSTKESFPFYLDNKTTDKSPDIIEALIELSKAEKLLTDEMELDNVETSKKSKTYLTNIEKSSEVKAPTSALNMVSLPINENIHSQIIENLEKAITKDIIVLEDENRDYSIAKISDTIMPQKISNGDLQKNIDTIECDKLVLIADEANMLLDDHNMLLDDHNMLLDDHLDEAYLSDCSNSNLGQSGSTGSTQDTFEPLSNQRSCSDVKHSKISILSEEIIEPSRFNHILEKAKKSHQKDNFIPVSINTVVSLGHRNSDFAIMNHDVVKTENDPKKVSFVESNSVDNKPILIEFIDEYGQTPENVIQSQFATSTDTVSKTNVISHIPKEEANEEVSSPFMQCSFDENSDVVNPSASHVESNKDHIDKQTKSDEKVEEIASYLAKFAHILAHRKKNAIAENRKKMLNKKRSTTNSRFRKEGVEKPGGDDKADESQEEDECQSHKIWRTYRISQKMPHPLNNNWKLHKTKTMTTEDKINVQNSAAIDDIHVDFDLSEDFGSLCYYETAEDLYEHFKSDDPQISLEEMFYETDNYIDVIYSDVTYCNHAENMVEFLDINREPAKEDKNAHPVHEKLAYDIADINTKEKEIIENIIESSDACKHLEVDEQLPNDHSRILSAHEYSGENTQENVITESKKKSKKTVMSIFDAMEKDINDILNKVDIDDDNNAENDASHFNFEEVALCDEESVEADGAQDQFNVDKPNKGSKIIDVVAAPEKSTRKKRRHSAVANSIQQERVVAAPSPKKTIKCGVCQKALSDNEWNDHLSNEHCYIAWKDGQAVDFKSNVLLSNLNTRLKISALKCTFCNKEYRACKKFLSHVRQCLETHEKCETAAVSSCECGVCHDKVDGEKWLEHIKTRHHYIAWKEGETPIKLKKDTKRHLESVLMLHGCLECSVCGLGIKHVDSFTDHIKTCGNNSSNEREEVIRRQSSASDSDLKLSDLKELKKSSERSSKSSRDSSLRKSVASPEPPKKNSKRRSSRQTVDTPNSGSTERRITDFGDPKQKIGEESTTTKSKVTNNLLSTDLNTSNKFEEALSNSFEEESEKRNRRTSTTNETAKRTDDKTRKSAPNVTAKRRKDNKLLTSSALETEPKTPKLDEPKLSEVDTPTTSLLVPTRKIRKRNRLVSDEIDSTGISQISPDSNITDNDTTTSEEPVRNRRKSVSNKTQKMGENSGEPEKSKTRNKRKCTQEERANPKDQGSEDFLTGRGKSSCKKARPETDTKNTSSYTQNVDRNYEVSTNTRISTQGKASENPLEDSLRAGQDNGSQSACDKSKDVSQTIAPDLQTKIKSEPGTSEENSVECGVCQERVEADSWMSHSQMKHQFLAWHTGEKALDLEDETKVLEHLKGLVKSLGSIACSKCGLARKQPRKFLKHIESCDVSGIEVPVLNTSLVSTVKTEHYSNDILTTKKIVTCAICHEDVKSETWEDHASKLHYNIAWPVGGVPIDRRNTWQVEKILKAYKSTVRDLQCNVCGITRASCLGFYAHVLVCGKKDEEVEQFKDTCELCHQKYLCIYRQQHYAFHAQQQISKQRKAEALELKEKLAQEKEQIKLETQSGRRKAAEKARKFVSENYADIKEQFQHQCPDCDYGTDSKIKWGEHVCGQDGSDAEDSFKGEEGSEGDVGDEGEEDEGDEEEVIDSNASDVDQSEISPKKIFRKKKKSADYSKPRLVDVPFKVRDIKHYLRKSDKDFCNLHFTSNSLFIDWVPANYEILPDCLAKPFLPPLEESCKVKSEDGGWTTFKTFEARVDKVPTFFVGATPQCISWAPPRYHVAGDRSGSFLAMAGRGPNAPRLGYERTYRHDGLLQIWDFGLFDGLPRVALCIAHSYGAVWDMAWCPSGARDELPELPELPSSVARLGLLALACSDGAAYVFSVPYPSTLPDRSSLFYKLKPVVELRYDDRKQFQCTAIKWSSQRGHATIAAGYSDGSVAFYNLDGGSPLGQGEHDAVWVLYPYYDERVQSTCITGLDLFASMEESADTGLACAASVTGLSLWARRGDTVAKTQIHTACSGAHFQPHWPSVLPTGEDPMAVTEVEWDGWRGRAGPRRAAVSARSGLLAAHCPPVLRVALGHRLHRDMPRKRVAAIEMKPLSGKRKKERPNTEFEMKVEPRTYDSAVASYGLELTLLNSDRPAWPNTDESRPERYPLSDVTAMAFCPHPKFHSRLAVATHAGIVYLFTVTTQKLLPHPRNKSEISRTQKSKASTTQKSQPKVQTL